MSSPPVVAGPVLEALSELRYAKEPAVTAKLGGRFTSKQVQKALHNLKTRGLVESDGIVRVKGFRGGAMATYWVAGDEPPEGVEVEEEEDLFCPNRYYPKRPSYPSVWHYAQSFVQEPRRVASVWELGTA